jgi:membrane protein
MSSTSTPNRLGDRSLADLTKQLSQDVAGGHRKGAAGGVGVGMIAAAAVLGLVGLAALTAAAILGLATTLAAWLSALIVAAVVGLVAGTLALVGVKRVQRATPPVPTETAESVKEDVAWIKTQAKPGMK